MLTNIEAARTVERFPHVLSADAPFLSDRMTVHVDFAMTDGNLLSAFGDPAAQIAGAAGYRVDVVLPPPSTLGR
jgi:hypothetical protein